MRLLQVPRLRRPIMFLPVLFLAIFFVATFAAAQDDALDCDDQQCHTPSGDSVRHHHSLLQRTPGWRAAAPVRRPLNKTNLTSSGSEFPAGEDMSLAQVSGAASRRASVPQPANSLLTMENTIMQYFGDDNLDKTKPGKSVCGTRPLFPQLQLELEVYRELGLVKSQYSRCRVPSIWSVTRNVAGDGLASAAGSVWSTTDSLMRMNWRHVGERRSYAAQGAAITFCLVALVVLAGHLYNLRQREATGADDEQKVKNDSLMLHSAWKSGATHFMGTALEWVEPVIGRYGWGAGPVAMACESSEDSAAMYHDAYTAFRLVWQQEVQSRGLEHAKVLRAVWNFLGARVFCWLVLTAGIATMLELAAMTVVLDMLLNYLHLARAAREANPDVGLDVLQPTLMFICLGFGVPMLARVFHNMTALSDTHHTNRITAGLLTVLYEKSQHLPFCTDGGGDEKRKDCGDLLQLLTNDVRNAWAGALTAATHLIIQPICVGVLVIFLIRHLGKSAIFGLLSTFWIAFVYIPIQNHVATGSSRWGSLASSRLGLVREAMLNVRTVKATAWDRPLAEKIYATRETELQTRFRFSMVQSLLDVPFNLFPFALMVSSLFFCCILHGTVLPREIFACMQVLSGLTYCTPALTRCLHKSLNLPNTAKRVELFLQQPEKDVKSLRAGGTGGSGAVRVRGSFAIADGQRPVLRELDFQAKRGELIAVVGEVASGKSALLSAIMGELPGADNEALVEAPKNPIFCSQTPWVVDGTLKDNVMLGESENQDRLYDALDSASMLKDIIASDAPVKEKTAAQSSTMTRPMNTHMTQMEEYVKNNFPYFGTWNVCAVFVFVCSVANVDWQQTRPALGLLIAAIQGLLHWSVLEFPIQTVATLMTTTRKLAKIDGSHMTITLNYNLLATSQADVDECMHNMLEAYLNNLHENVSAVLVSATNDPNLQQYELQVRNDHRARVYKELFRSGLAWSGFVEGTEVKPEWRDRVWSKYDHLDKNEFVQRHLNGICERYAREYMVLHRTSRVLRKCGQYQDMILLSAGEPLAFTYCDFELYGRAARKEGEPLFKASADTDNVCGRNFDYTLVLDSDTRVEAGSVIRMLDVAAAYPEKAIVQPAIKMDCGPDDSIFMHLEAMRQRVYEPMNNTMTTLLGKSSFFGKGLIKNSAYAKYCLGTRDRLIESVPIDVLSHDTFEAAVTNPLYLNSVYLLEAPCHNYITWDIRERRWNLGELLLAMYFWPNGVGRPVQWLQSKFQGNKFNRIQVRTITKLDKVSAYFAHSALRQMVCKPMLLAYIVVMHFVEMRWKWTPFCAVMFSIIIFPKFATCTRNNYKDVLLETGASILQFTPEAIVGTIRVLSAVKAHLAGAATWVPQRSVEEESKVSNPFVFSLRYLWYYSAFALVWGLRVGLWAASVGPEAMFIITILGTLFMLPLYVGFTSLPANILRSISSGKTREPENPLEKDNDGGKLENSTDAALQALRVRLPKMRIRQIQTVSQANPQRREAALNVFNATNVCIGTQGVRLSNGDRARISLARAAYSKRSNLVLIDDPFTMVDVQTGQHILHKLIRGPMMEGRTRIVAMAPYLDYLEHFDRVVLMQEGKMVAEGTPKRIKLVKEFQELLAKMAQDQSLEGLQVSKPFVAVNPGESPLKLCDHGANEVVEQEEQRPPQWGQLWRLISIGGMGRLSLAVLSVVSLRLVAQGQMILLGRWADKAAEADEVGGTYYMMMTGMMIIVSVLQVLQGYSILMFNSIVSRHVFRTAFSTLLKAPIDAFWNKQPVGRVIGRLSADILNVDMELSTGCVALSGIFADLIVQQAFCLIVMPIWLIVPMYGIIYAFGRLFCNTAIQLQILSALAISRCQEEQAQLAASRLSIHAFQYETKMISQYCAHAGSIVTPDSLASYAKVWVATRITFCLCFQSTVCVLFGILRPETMGMGSLAVLMAATFHIIQQLSGFMDSLVSVVSIAVSLQRLSDLSNVPQEPAEQLSGDEQKRSRLIADGVGVRIEGLRMGYGSGLDVLTNINVDIQSRTKVVLVGGPGSGKTTILHCILRLLEPRAGRILFNGTDIRNLGLLALRSMIGLVPQEPSVFRGTIRFNIDPFGQYPDERIWAAIQCAQLLPTVQRLQKGLDHVLADDGNNFSYGQKQLLSLARVVCQQPPLLLLDECCSSLDPRTQEAVQDTITLNFPNSTIVSTTRRMDEIAHFNHMVLLEKGTVVRQGPVSRLLEGLTAPAPAPAPAPA